MSNLRGLRASSSNNSILSYFRKPLNPSSFSAASPPTPPTSDPDVASISSEATSKPLNQESHELTQNTQTLRDLGLSANCERFSAPSRRQSSQKSALGDPGVLPQERHMTGGREEEAENDVMYDSIQVLDGDWEIPLLPEPPSDKERQAAQMHRQRSKSSGIGTTDSDRSGSSTSSLGKRGREAMNSINAQRQRRRSVPSDFTEVEETEEGEDVEDEEEDGEGDDDADSIIAPASKKTRFSEEDGEIMALLEEDATPKKKPAAPKPRKKRVFKARPYVPPPPFRPKTWLTQGLYVGQDPDFDPRLTETKNRLKRASMGVMPGKRRTIMPMPMFSGARMLDKGRDFRLPFDVYGPLPSGQPKPEEWKKISKSASHNMQTINCIAY